MRLQSLFVLAASVCIAASGVTVTSPDGKTIVDVNLNPADSTLTYSISIIKADGTKATMVVPSPLGFIANEGDFSRGLTLREAKEGTRSDSYSVWQGKKKDIAYKANTLEMKLRNADGKKFAVEFEVSDNNVGYRYTMPIHKDTRCIVLEKELSGYRFPEGTTTFLTDYHTPMKGWMRTQPSYEEYYEADAALDRVSKYGLGYTYPALFHRGDDGWVLIGETGVTGRSNASHLADPAEGNLFTVAYADPRENNGFGSTGMQLGLPMTTPWRTITVGETLNPIVETTVYTDLVDQQYEPSEEYKGRRSTWSWIVWQDGSIVFDDQKTFIDLAAELGWESCLIDGLWSQQIGREKMEELFAYAKEKGVEPLVWYNSNGAWNDAPQGLRMAMDNPVSRKKEMKWLKDHGVKGIKVDFFAGDKQETMKLYEQILSDANDYGISVIFHGCTMPRGWERMYPNYISSEAVRASENLVFNQSDCDIEAFNAALHPFIRNSLGAMEFGGTFLQHRLNRNSEKGNTRRTGDIFQLATAILFQSAIQNFALTPASLTEAPQFEIDFMKAVPTTWDETVLIDGYPGRYVVLARRSGDRWYVAAINADSETKKIKLNLPMLAGKTVDAYTERMPRKKEGLYMVGSVAEKTIPTDGMYEFVLPTGGGAVLVEK